MGRERHRAERGGQGVPTKGGGEEWVEYLVYSLGFLHSLRFLRMIFLHNRELMVTKAKQSSRSFTASLAVFSAQRQLSKTIKTNVN